MNARTRTTSPTIKVGVNTTKAIPAERGIPVLIRLVNSEEDGFSLIEIIQVDASERPLLLDFFETNFIDKASHSLSSSIRWVSNKFAITQNGQLQIQSITFFLGLVIIISGYFSWLLLGGN